MHPGFRRHFAIENTGLSSVEKPLVKPGNTLGFPEKTYGLSRGFLWLFAVRQPEENSVPEVHSVYSLLAPAV
jgi:hypothetical protein